MDPFLSLAKDGGILLRITSVAHDKQLSLVYEILMWFIFWTHIWII